MTDRTHPDSGPVTPGEACFTAADMATAAAQGFRDGVASMSLPAAGQEPVAKADHLTGDAKLAHDQCRAVVHLAQALAEVYQANALILAAGQGPVEIIGQASAEVMEIVGDILNSTDAMDEEDLWLDPIYDAAQARWPSERAAAPQPAGDWDHGPQATTVAEAARDVGKWLNERPNRPIDLRHVAMLAHYVQQAAPAVEAGLVNVPASDLEALLKESTGERGHVFMGLCPDETDITRHDDECECCLAIARIRAAMAAQKGSAA